MRFKTCILLLLVVYGIARADSAGLPPKAQETNPKPAEAEESLKAAYRREYAFLDSQRRQLQQLLEDLRRSPTDQEKRLEGKIAALEQQILNLSQEVKRREEALLEAQKQKEAAQEDAALLETTLIQAKTSLEDYGLKADEAKASAAEQLDRLFQLALKALQQGSTPHRQPGSFFLPDGQEARGEILWLGNVAAYGVSPAASGILLPAGEERLKLLDSPKGTEVAHALAAGEKPSVLPLFLFESLKQAVELEQTRTWRQELDDGGPIAWLTAGLGVLGLALAAIRSLILTRAGWGGKRLTREVVAGLARDAATAHVGAGFKPAGYGPVLQASLSHLQSSQEEWEIAVSDALLQQSLRLDRFANLILVIAAVAPLLGLLGTVTGMIETFDVITRFGTGDPKLLAHGIAVALITTEVGLIVAIPLLLIGNLLNGWAANLKADMELSALAVREAAQEPVALAKGKESPSPQYLLATRG